MSYHDVAVRFVANWTYGYGHDGDHCEPSVVIIDCTEVMRNEQVSVADTRPDLGCQGTSLVYALMSPGGASAMSCHLYNCTHDSDVVALFNSTVAIWCQCQCQCQTSYPGARLGGDSDLGTGPNSMMFGGGVQLL